MKIRKVIYMVLSIIMVSGAIPAMAFASEWEKEPIYTIDINDLTIPKEGEEPDYDVSIPSEKGYHIHNDSENRNEKNGVVWDEVVSDVESKVLRPGESVFESGKRYIAVSLLLQMMNTGLNKMNTVLIQQMHILMEYQLQSQAYTTKIERSF